MVFLERFRLLGRSPITVIEFVIALFTIIPGVYLLSPLLDLSAALHGASPLILALGSGIAISLYGVLAITIGVVDIIAIWKRSYKWRQRSLFYNILFRLYGLIVGIIAQPLPPTWMSGFALLLIVIVCYSVVKGLDVRGIKS